MEQLFIDVVEPYKPKSYTDTPRKLPRPDGWFESDGEQLALLDARTPDSVTPLWYVGAKQTLYPLLVHDILPAGITDIVSPFMGGCSLELKLAASGYRVHAYDKFRPIVEFFQTFQQHADAVVSRVLEIYPIYTGSDETHAHYMHLVRGGGWEALTCPIDRAAHTWAISRQSYMGKNFASPPVKPRYASRLDFFRNPIASDGPIRRHHRSWRDWRNDNITFGEADYKDSLSAHDCIAYLDPPYVLKSRFYGRGQQGEFNHEELRDILAERQGFIMSYGDDPLIWELYQDFKILRPQWKYNCGKDAASQASSELLILSHDVEGK